MFTFGRSSLQVDVVSGQERNMEASVRCNSPQTQTMKNEKAETVSGTGVFWTLVRKVFYSSATPDNSYLLALSTSRQNQGGFSSFKCKWERGLNPQTDGTEERVSGGHWSLTGLYHRQAESAPSPKGTSEAASWIWLCFYHSIDRGQRRKQKKDEKRRKTSTKQEKQEKQNIWLLALQIPTSREALTWFRWVNEMHPPTTCCFAQPEDVQKYRPEPINVKAYSIFLIFKNLFKQWLVSKEKHHLLFILHFSRRRVPV